jgi:hypothetical protein
MLGEVDDLAAGSLVCGVSDIRGCLNGQLAHGLQRTPAGCFWR